MFTDVELDLELLWRTHNALLETFKTHDGRIRREAKEEKVPRWGGKKKKKGEPKFNDIRLCQRCTELKSIVAVHNSFLYYFTYLVYYFGQFWTISYTTLPYDPVAH